MLDVGTPLYNADCTRNIVLMEFSRVKQSLLETFGDRLSSDEPGDIRAH